MSNEKYTVGENVTISLDGDEYYGQRVEVIGVLSHEFGVDLRVIADDGAEFWTCSKNVL